MNPAADTFAVMDWAFRAFHATPESAPAIIDRLNQVLSAARAALEPARWTALVADCRSHAVCALLLEDPLTRRSFTKPRGYAGDAELLDIIYTRDWRGICPDCVSPLGEMIFRHTIECQAPSAVRHRSEHLAQTIDRLCEQRPGAEILSVACGHLRELKRSQAMAGGRIGRIVGLDQDAASLEEVRRTWPGGRVETITASIKALWGRALRDRRFDLVYSAGLYDYLGEDIARRLTSRLFDFVRPGGQLLIANYHPDLKEVGYMETFMDWRLIYRDEEAITRVAGDLPRAEVASLRVRPDQTGAVVYLEVERRT